MERSAELPWGPWVVTLIFVIFIIFGCAVFAWVEYEDNLFWEWDCARFIAEYGPTERNTPLEPLSEHHSGASSAMISEPGSQETRQDRPVLPEPDLSTIKYCGPPDKDKKA